VIQHDTRRWHAELAWLPRGVERDVLIEAVGDRFTAVRAGVPPESAGGAVRLSGLTLPGLANAHSHAFHRALRGITQAGLGTFWTWRQTMYQVAARLEPDSYLALARAVYAEMTLAGVTCVGEFHYLHHGPGGVPYADPNAMGRALLQAAAEAGLRITLLDTCYLSSGLPVSGSGVSRGSADPGGAGSGGPGARSRGSGAAGAGAAAGSAGFGGGGSGTAGSGATAGSAGFGGGGSGGWGLSGAGSPEPLAGPLVGPQLRFGDGDADRWAARVAALGAGPGGVLGPAARLGAAIHSVRAVPRDQLPVVAAWAATHGAPLHAHLSEQPAENEACLAAYGVTPAGLLDQAGALGPASTMVHATHLTERDIALLGGSRTCACFCPTTEADLADGIGPARALASAGSPLSVGSDSHAVIDLFAEARGIELTQRLATGQRGQFAAADLATAATAAGHACLGWPDAGRLAPGALADLVSVALDTPRLAGTADATALEAIVFAATAADVTDVVVGARDVVRDRRHLLIPDVPAALSAAIRAVLP
jgi:cytosine/adenosine deaminase-related metal-dependent hydrolase